jgi:hypothetical protein
MVDVTVDEMIAHVRELAKSARIGLALDHTLPRHRAAALSLPGLPGIVDELNLIVAPTIRDDTGYAIVLHELGHHSAPGGKLRFLTPGPTSPKQEAELMIREEVAAWTWAQGRALCWTTAMEMTKEFALSSYCAHARTFGVEVK